MSIVAMFVVVPRYGVLGAAWVVTIAILLTRGVYLAVLICRVNGFPIRAYVAAIYGRPLATALPVAALGFALTTALPGRSWLELIAAGAVITAAYYSLAFFAVLERGHRMAVLTRLGLAA